MWADVLFLWELPHIGDVTWRPPGGQGPPSLLGTGHVSDVWADVLFLWELPHIGDVTWRPPGGQGPPSLLGTGHVSDVWADVLLCTGHSPPKSLGQCLALCHDPLF